MVAKQCITILPLPRRWFHRNAFSSPSSPSPGGGEGGAGVLAERTEEREISGSWRFVGALAKVRHSLHTLCVRFLDRSYASGGRP